jgi:hypothetical protein
MNDELEEMSNSLFDNIVPVLWDKVGYQATTPLSCWMLDLRK